MNKKISVLIFLLVTLLYPFKAQAITDSGTLNSQLKDARLERKLAITDAREAYKQKLATIKDERRKALVEKIDSRIASTNTNLTNKMTEALTRLNKIMEKLAKRAQILKTEGKDITLYEAAASKAQAAITSAITAVSTQAAKTYTITLTTDSLLKTNVGSTVSLFRTDISATHKLVIDAKQAVMKTATELAKLKEGNKNASNSATTQ